MTKEEQAALLRIAGTLGHLRAPLKRVDILFVQCCLCSESWPEYQLADARDAGNHDPICPWRLAVAFVEGEPRA